MAAAAVMKRAVVDKTDFFHQSFALLRSLSTSVAPPVSSSSGASESKPRRRKKKNLFDVIQFLPEWGIDYKVAKTHWRDVSYELTKINLYKDFSSPLRSSSSSSTTIFFSIFSLSLSCLMLLHYRTGDTARHGGLDTRLVFYREVYPAGLPTPDAPVKMSGVNKRGWKYFPESEKKIQNSPKVVEQSLA